MLKPAITCFLPSPPMGGCCNIPLSLVMASLSHHLLANLTPRYKEQLLQEEAPKALGYCRMLRNLLQCRFLFSIRISLKNVLPKSLYVCRVSLFSGVITWSPTAQSGIQAPTDQGAAQPEQQGDDASPRPVRNRETDRKLRR